MLKERFILVFLLCFHLTGIVFGDSGNFIEVYTQAHEQYSKDRERALDLAKSALKIAYENKVPYEISKAAFFIGIIEYEYGNYYDALVHFENAIQNHDSLNSKSSIVDIQLYMAYVFYEAGLYTQSEKIMLECLDYYRSISDVENSAKVFHALGLLNFKNANLVSAKQYFSESIKYGSFETIYKSYYQLSILRYNQSDFEGYKSYLDSAMSYAKKTGSVLRIAIITNSQALFFQKRGDFKEAIRLSQSAISSINGNKNFRYFLPQMYLDLARSYRLINQIQKSYDALLIGIEIAREMNSKQILSKILHEMLVVASMLDRQSDVEKFNDELISIHDQNSQLRELVEKQNFDIKYQSDKITDLEIGLESAAIQAEIEDKEDQTKYSRFVLIVVIILGVSLLGFGVLVFLFLRQRTKRLETDLLHKINEVEKIKRQAEKSINAIPQSWRRGDSEQP